MINKVNSIKFGKINSDYNHLPYLVNSLGSHVELPNKNRNYATFDEEKVNKIAGFKEAALPHLKKLLQTSNDEKQICEALYTLDKLCDMNVKGVSDCYGIISRFNRSNSPNIQAFLAGVYRKTQVPDAFGPLVNMLLKNSQKPDYPYFDPSEEIGGAILEYIKNYSSKSLYTNHN